MTIRIVLAEDSFIVREGVRMLIENESGLEIVATCDDYDSLLAAVDEHAPDVVLTDIRMPPNHSDEGIRAAQRIRESHPDMGVLVLSQYIEPDYALKLFEHGSQGRGYLLKEHVGDVDHLLTALTTVHEGGSSVDPAVVEALVSARVSPGSILDRLTPRETEVLSLIAQGRNNAGIAAELVLTERAIEKHINSIFSKLDVNHEVDVHRRVRAVLLYLADA